VAVKKRAPKQPKRRAEGPAKKTASGREVAAVERAHSTLSDASEALVAIGHADLAVIVDAIRDRHVDRRPPNGVRETARDVLSAEEPTDAGRWSRSMRAAQVLTDISRRMRQQDYSDDFEQRLIAYAVLPPARDQNKTEKDPRMSIEGREVLDIFDAIRVATGFAKQGAPPLLAMALRMKAREEFAARVTPEIEAEAIAAWSIKRGRQPAVALPGGRVKRTGSRECFTSCAGSRSARGRWSCT